MFSRNNQASNERRQERLDAGLMSKHFPEVSSIVISMTYNQRGMAKPIHRIVNFSPESYAFFKVTCLSRDCVDGGFDMTRIITSMIRNHSEASKGELGCDDQGPRPDHSDIAYDIQIKFS